MAEPVPIDPTPTDSDWERFQEAPHPLDKYLGGVLAGNGSAFEAAGQKYGVDPTLLAAIATFESGHGTSRAARVYNNPTGMMDSSTKDSKGFMKFDSIPDAIDATASNLARNYLEKGLSTIPQIADKYAPTDAKNDPKHTNVEWPGSVQQIYQKMGGTREQFGPTKVADVIPQMRGS